MRGKLYWKLAKNNLVRNRLMYLPYAVAVAIMSAMFFVILNIVFSRSITNVHWESSTLMAMMLIGLVVMGLFTAGYMFHLNSFLIKRRKTEFGLYGVLGLEKKHVCAIVRHESLLLNSFALALGLLAGTVFGRLIFMLLMVIVSLAPDSVFTLSPPAYIITAAFFCLIFIGCTGYNQLQVRLANPIDLIRGEKKAEKPLRGAGVLTALGVLLVGGAYFAANYVRVSGIAIGLFWPAVIAVIIGTNCLFLGGSQTVLRALKKNDGFYYRPSNFISVSGLMHRMKQNAAGLANICILSTMVLVTVSSVCSLFFGREQIAREQCPNDCDIKIYYDRRLERPDVADALATAQETARACGVRVEDTRVYSCVQDSVRLENGKFSFKDAYGNLSLQSINSFNSVRQLYIVTLDEYNALTGERETLADGELLVLTGLPVKEETLDINGSRYAVKDVRADNAFIEGKNSAEDNVVFFVARDGDAAAALRYAVNPGIADDNVYSEYGAILEFIVNIDGEKEARYAYGTTVPLAVYEAVRPQLDGATYSFTSIDKYWQEGNSIYGGLLFLGIYFAILFLVNTVLIMYFKQVSEGYEDHERYVILQKVGMGEDEVKSTINRQVLIVFFLPLLAALVHVFAAGNMIVQMLNAFVMTDSAIGYACIAVTSVIFSLVYIVVFRLTARTYYKLVKW